ncbi:MAG TPA: hypothetical protein VHL53_17040 [Acidimicrobiia bacterium]|nr:hypothetical protein [Acidimicrobiia bacterium]
MLKRLRWIVMGMGVGASASVWAQRKVKALMRSYTPPEVASRAARRSQAAAGRTAGEVRTALAEGRQAMRQREAELRHQIDQHQKQPPPL